MKLIMIMTGTLQLRKITFVFLLALVFNYGHAQDRKFELSLKGSALGMTGDDGTITGKDVFLYGFGVEGVYFPNRFLGIGGSFYEYVAGETDGTPNSGQLKDQYLGLDSKGRAFGMSLQLTTNRTKILRVYANGKFSYLQLRDIHDTQDFAIYNEGYTITAGLGVMLKLTRGIAFNLFEAGYVIPSKKLSYSDEAKFTGFTVSSGFTFKMVRAK